jgi:hypothetical protein
MCVKENNNNQNLQSVSKRALQLWKSIQIYTEDIHNALNCRNVAKHCTFDARNSVRPLLLHGDDHYRCRVSGRATCLLAGLLNYSSTLKMEAIRSSETSGTSQRTTRRHIPEYDTLHAPTVPQSTIRRR